MLSIHIPESLVELESKKEENRILFLKKKDGTLVKFYEDQLRENSAMFQRFLREQFSEIADDIRLSLLDLLACIKQKDATDGIATIQGEVLGAIETWAGCQIEFFPVWVGYESNIFPGFDPYKNIAQPR